MMNTALWCIDLLVLGVLHRDEHCLVVNCSVGHFAHHCTLFCAGLIHWCLASCLEVDFVLRCNHISMMTSSIEMALFYAVLMNWCSTSYIETDIVLWCIGMSEFSILYRGGSRS